MSSEDFNKTAKSGWRVYSEVSGFSAGLMLGMFSLAMYMKPGAPRWWLGLAVAGGLAAAGSVVSLFSGLNQDMKDAKENAKEDDRKDGGPQPKP